MSMVAMLENKLSSAKAQIKNGVGSDMPKEELLVDGVTENDLAMLEAQDMEDFDQLDPFYLSDFMPWNSYKNYIFAKSRGFHDLTHEWNRTNHAENLDQVDSIAYLIHPW